MEDRDSPAVRHKAEGDEHTRSRRFELAETCYSQALDADPTAHTVWGNRSLVRLKLNRFDDAAADALRATHLAPAWAKGWARLGAAERARGRPVQSALAYRQALRLEPKNKEFDRLLLEVEAECGEQLDAHQLGNIASSETLPAVIPHNVNELVLLQNEESLQWLHGAMCGQAPNLATIHQVMAECLDQLPPQLREGLGREEQLAVMMQLLEKEPHRFPQFEGMMHMFAQRRSKQTEEAYLVVPTLQIHDEHWCVSWTETYSEDPRTGRHFYVVTVMVLTGVREGMVVGSEQCIDVPDGNTVLSALWNAMAFPMPMVGPPRRPAGVLVANWLVNHYATIAGELLAVDIACRLESRAEAAALHSSHKHQTPAAAAGAAPALAPPSSAAAATEKQAGTKEASAESGTNGAPSPQTSSPSLMRARAVPHRDANKVASV